MALPIDYVIEPNGKLDAEAVQRNFDAIAASTPSASGRAIEIRYGNALIVFSASQTSAALTVNHGLGRTPSAITFGGADAAVKVAWASKTATTFQIIGRHEAVVSGSVLVDWIAVG